ncbi:MAG: SurA N-terminal domain-containing protein [Chromatiaceae bacterium]|nr:SurA N-terminal domain-containing protein [Chromatiaceae bacterium]
MLQTIRERAQGWIAWVIVILISVPFALWGIQSYLGVGAEPVVASVNGTEITQRELDERYRSFRSRLREQLGSAYRPELFDDKKMRSEVLDQMIRDRLLLQASESLGLHASKRELRAAILSNPAFQKNGSFDNATYEYMLEMQGMTPVQFEDSMRRRILTTQLMRAILATEILSDKELEEGVRLDRQQRRLSFVRVPKSAFLTDEPIADEEIATYYESNESQFQIPERVKVQYLVLDAETMAPAEIPGDEELRERYQEDLSRFAQPERRRVRHILVALDAAADEAAEDEAKAKIEEIRARIAAGEDFAALAKELSQDPGSADQGGDLGLIEQGLMDPAFDKVAFALDANQISEAVRSRFGYHLIEVTEIEPARTKPFEEVKDQLIADLQQRDSEGQFFDWAERLATLSYESPDSLEPAAEALGLELQTSDWIDRSGGEGILAHPQVIAAAFSDEVLVEGNNSDLIEPEHDKLQAIVLRVVEHEEATTRPLDEVRDEIVTVLREKRAADAALAKAAELADALKAGEDLSVATGDLKVEDLGLVARDAAQVPVAIRDFAFALKRPAPGGSSYGSLSLPDGDGAAVILSEVLDGSLEQLDKATRDEIRKNLAQGIGRAYYDDLLADLESRADIERTPLGEGLEE